MNTFAFTLDLSKTAYMEPLRIRQGDHNGTTVQATILDHGVALDGSYTARFCMRHPGTGATYYRETGTYANGVATVALDEQYAASVPGRTTAYIQLLQGSTVIASTSDIPVVILHDATEDAVPGEVYDSAIEDALAELDEATGRISVMVQEQVAEELAAHPEWTTTVQDNSLTDAKLVQSGGILSRNQRLMYRLANLLTHRTDEGTLAAISDAAKTPMAGLSVYGLSTQDGTPTPSSPVPIVSVEPDSEGNISLLARGKNLLPYTAGATATGNGVTLTVQEDGGLRVTGTATANYALVMPTFGPVEVAGTFSYTKTGTAPSFFLSLRNYGTTTYVDLSVIRTSIAVDGSFDRLHFYVYQGNTYDCTVYPQLELGSIATAYEPYTSTSTPIDLDGHELRSLPDGTRDELTVDAEGHVTLVQRVGSVDLGTDWNWSLSGGGGYRVYTYDMRDNHGFVWTNDNQVINARSNRFGMKLNSQTYRGEIGISADAASSFQICFTGQPVTVADWKSWLAENPVTVDYALATPVTHDLGIVPLVPLVGPDLTAQTVPTAPFVLDAERDLNVTLARLESAIAALA